MVYPSLGCHTCKRRRIKCDTTRPLCGRCRKANYSCTWDTPEDEILPFRSENAFAQGKPRRPWKRARDVWIDGKKLSKPYQYGAILPTLPFSIETQAVCYWVENFTFQMHEIPDMGHEYSSYVMEYWSRARPESGLYLALLALAHAVFGRAKRSRKAIEATNTFFGRTIMKVKADIEDVASEDLDQSLLTIMLMGSFENTMWGLNPQNPRSSLDTKDEVGSRIWQNVCHHKGASGILGVRLREGIPSNLPLDRTIWRQIIRICILRGVTGPTWFDTAVYEEESVMRKFDSLMVWVARLRAKSLSLFENKNLKSPSGCSTLRDSAVSSPQEIATEAEELDRALEAWSITVSNEWSFSTSREALAFDIHTEEDLFDIRMHTYSSLGHATIWNRYRAVRIIANSIHIRALRTIQTRSMHFPSAVELLKTSQQRINLMTRDLCSGVVFFFKHKAEESTGTISQSVEIGDKDIESEFEILPKKAALLAWPLTIAVSAEGVPERERRWLRSRLKTVAEALSDAVLESIVAEGEFKF